MVHQDYASLQSLMNSQNQYQVHHQNNHQDHRNQQMLTQQVNFHSNSISNLQQQQHLAQSPQVQSVQMHNLNPTVHTHSSNIGLFKSPFQIANNNIYKHSPHYGLSSVGQARPLVNHQEQSCHSLKSNSDFSNNSARFQHSFTQEQEHVHQQNQQQQKQQHNLNRQQNGLSNSLSLISNQSHQQANYTSSLPLILTSNIKYENTIENSDSEETIAMNNLERHATSLLKGLNAPSNAYEHYQQLSRSRK
jgi:hypothetical protein